ncbi:odorant receptor 13a-like isoform X1 [Frieseomelitta varia]|uniref:odorant receptor 13a-like isoform X1 n=1 Tax=Frieseomelitta varia TaxID=561572 RepID=UPI001CB68E2C|nr:odorant receptor 13a-like isoform X1 [Frieseomelitta varia]
MTEFTTAEDSPHSLSDYSLQLNRWFLKPIGAWPLSASTSRLEKIVSMILNFLCYFFVLFTVIPCLFYLWLEDEIVAVKLKTLGPFSHWFIGGINYTTLLLRGKEMHSCIKHVQNDWKIITRKEDQKVMMKYAKIGRCTAAFCAAFMQGGVLSHCTISAFTKEIIEVGNETRTLRVLPCISYKKLIPVDTNPTNAIVLATQFVSGFIVNSSAAGAVSIAAVFAAHACGQLSIMTTWVNEFVTRSKNRNSNVRLNEVGKIVEHHLRVLSFITGIENVMTEICFMELFKCTLNICMLGYYILTELQAHNLQITAVYSVILCSMIFNIFIICYIGDTLTEKCKNVGDTVYMTNWHYLPYKDVLDLIQIILRSSMVIKITAGNENRIRLFESVAANDVTKYTLDLLMNKIVKFKI